jgi:hypothetical protein
VTATLSEDTSDTVESIESSITTTQNNISIIVAQDDDVTVTNPGHTNSHEGMKRLTDRLYDGKDSDNGPAYTLPLPLTSPTDEDIDEKLFLILQNAVRETYFAYRDILGKRYVRTRLKLA